MELSNLISSIETLSLDTETTLTDQIDKALKASTQLTQFNKSNESKFHFEKSQYFKDLAQLLFEYLQRAVNYMNRVEKLECPEEFTLTDVYYSLACQCLNAIRILSRDSDVIEGFLSDDLLGLIQEIADLKGLVLCDEENQAIISSEPNFNGKDSLTLQEAEIVLKTRERSELILTALKTMSNLLYNSKPVQKFYTTNSLAINISTFIRNLLKSSTHSIYVNEPESKIILFRLKLLFLSTVFSKETRQILNEKHQLLTNLQTFLTRLNLKEEIDCCLATECLKVSYNLTMDIDSVRVQARDALSSIKPPDSAFINTADGPQVQTDMDEIVFKKFASVLQNLLTSECFMSKRSELTSNSINLLTNMPAICYEYLIPDSVETDKDSTKFEGKSIKSISVMLGFLGENLNLYISQKIPADILYPVLMLCSVMSKTNRTIRHYLRSMVLPPLTKGDLVNLPQNGKTHRNFLVRLMTDPNLQLKRLCAQFLFILCKENVGRLIKYTGYGNAAGLLAEVGLMMSTHGDDTAYSSGSDNSDSEDYQSLEKDINVITGQAEIEPDTTADNLMNETECKAREMRRKRQDVFDGMSEEQKEYEAMQLVNAIDKLTKMGGSGFIKPATIGPDGRPTEIESVLQLQKE